MKVSYFTTCMNRLHHLRQTLPINIKSITNHNLTEFIILDYSSTDGLKNWVRENMMKYIDSGLVKYFEVKGKTYFTHNHAKNMAAKCTSPGNNIICSLDADNFLGKELYCNLTDRLIYLFKSNERDIFVRAKGWDYREKDWWSMHSYKYYSCSGKIAVKRKDFFAAQGFDEHMQGHCYDEEEFWQRLKQTWNFKHIELPIDYSVAINHTNYERLKNLNPNIIDLKKILNYKKEGVEIINNMYLTDSMSKKLYPNALNNKKIYLENINKQIKRPNNGKWGQGVVFKNFSKKPIQLEI